ncbi:hypothetical protein BGZ95_003208 [Linnemannia exigua]|uniref:F-box domain-containing protein n=1 Tax=Linnemannia exigua TaxID=604196 RepID=A0AAD4DI22_9FUNG|nr:hypothetical protein BGZ95_003208 [Linnemannia exigua]
MSASSKLFDILELTTPIADNLSQHDLAACCLVNHSWFNTFTPYLWHTITIQVHDPLPAKFTTPEGRTGLARNGRHIRVLHTHNLESLGLFLGDVGGGGGGIGGDVGCGETLCKNLVVLDTEYGPGAGRNMTISDCKLRSGAMMSKERSSKGLVGGCISVDMQRQTVGEPRTLQEYNIAQGEGRLDYEPEDLEQARAAELDLSTATNIPTVGFLNARAMHVEKRIRDRACQIAKARREAKARQMLVRILEQNPRLEFLIVPPHCLESDVVVKVAAEGLPLLRELYSSSTMWRWGYPAKFLLADHRRWPMYSKCVPSFGTLKEQQLAKTQEEEERELERQGLMTLVGKGIRGTVLETENVVPRNFLEGYPRLKDLELNMVKSINHDELEKLRTVNSEDLACLEFRSGYAAGIMQTLREVPSGLLKSIVLTDFRCSPAFLFANGPLEKVGQSVFLKHASTLEHLFARGCAIESKDIGDLLCASPRLKTIELLREDLGGIGNVDPELELQDAVRAPWMCDGLEVFECKISGVPRPDLSHDFFYYERSFAPYPVIPLCPEGPAVEPISPQGIIQRQSHALQRKFLKQLGQLRHLRILAFGSNNPAYESRESFALVLKGIRTMIVAEDVQHQCLELTLESGLDELSGLNELEELHVFRMAHRIGIEEVRWMVEQWPKLRAIRGLWCPDINQYFLNQRYEVGVEGEAEEEGGAGEGASGRVWTMEEAEHIVWLRKHRPDIQLLSS